MKIVYLTTEAVPLAKTGGLADVCGSLPARVAALGHDAAVIMPAFRSIWQSGRPVEPTDLSFVIPMDGKPVGARLLRSSLPDSDVPVWLIDQPQYFDRDALYGVGTWDYPDNAERFAFFCRAALQAITRLGWAADVIHCNDWQTGLVPAIMAAAPDSQPWIRQARSILTIHNLAYQGHFPADAFRWTGLDWSHFNQDEFEYYGQMNYLKTGIITADVVSTVSPRYAEEIRTPEQGCGLDPLLRGISDRLVGITNGIDDQIWNPATDPALAANYDLHSWVDGKRENKRALQQEFGLIEHDDLPLLGMVGRLAEQKGWDLILDVLRQHIAERRPTQWVVLGSGDGGIEGELKALAEHHRDQLALYNGFSDALAHRIEAASDLFLMPSRYEPCGLNQLYSLRYGTVPVVHRTGGLADTVADCTPETLANGSATGFHLARYEAAALDEAINRALRLKYHEPEKWTQIVQTGMAQDWSWRQSAAQYVELYERTISLIGKGGLAARR